MAIKIFHARCLPPFDFPTKNPKQTSKQTNPSENKKPISSSDVYPVFLNEVIHMTVQTEKPEECLAFEQELENWKAVFMSKVCLYPSCQNYSRYDQVLNFKF